MSKNAVILAEDAEVDPLTPKQRRFVSEYLVDLNATAAAKRAGYGSRSAHTQGYNLRRDPKVGSEIAKAIDKMSGITRNHIVNELGRIINAKIDDVVTWDATGAVTLTASADLTADQKAGIAKITQTMKDGVSKLQVDMFDKLTAIDKLSRVLNVVKDGGNATAAMQININFPSGTDAVLYGPKTIEGEAS